MVNIWLVSYKRDSESESGIILHSKTYTARHDNSNHAAYWADELLQILPWQEHCQHFQRANRKPLLRPSSIVASPCLEASLWEQGNDRAIGETFSEVPNEGAEDTGFGRRLCYKRFDWCKRQTLEQGVWGQTKEKQWGRQWRTDRNPQWKPTADETQGA